MLAPPTAAGSVLASPLLPALLQKAHLGRLGAERAAPRHLPRAKRSTFRRAMRRDETPVVLASPPQVAEADAARPTAGLQSSLSMSALVKQTRSLALPPAALARRQKADRQVRAATPDGFDSAIWRQLPDDVRWDVAGESAQHEVGAAAEVPARRRGDVRSGSRRGSRGGSRGRAEAAGSLRRARGPRSLARTTSPLALAQDFRESVSRLTDRQSQQRAQADAEAAEYSSRRGAAQTQARSGRLSFAEERLARAGAIYEQEMLEARHRLEATSGFREEQLKAQEGLLKEAQGKAREERRRLRDMGVALRGKMRAAQEVDAIRQREAARATVGAGNVRTQNPFAQPATLVCDTAALTCGLL